MNIVNLNSTLHHSLYNCLVIGYTYNQLLLNWQPTTAYTYYGVSADILSLNRFTQILVVGQYNSHNHTHLRHSTVIWQHTFEHICRWQSHSHSSQTTVSINKHSIFILILLELKLFLIINWRLLVDMIKHKYLLNMVIVILLVLKCHRLSTGEIVSYYLH